MARRSKLPKRKKIKKKVPIIWKIHKRGWTAEIIRNEDGGGWAVTMTRDGDEAPVYMAPWTMGRNKVDPKPMSNDAFNTWVKSASEFLMRSQYQSRTTDRKSLTLTTEEGEELTISFDIRRGEYESVGLLKAEDVFGSELVQIEVSPLFTLTTDSARDWVRSGFEPPPPPPEPELVLADEALMDEQPLDEDERIVDEEYVVEEVYIQEYDEPVFEYD